MFHIHLFENIPFSTLRTSSNHSPASNWRICVKVSMTMPVNLDTQWKLTTKL